MKKRRVSFPCSFLFLLPRLRANDGRRRERAAGDMAGEMRAFYFNSSLIENFQPMSKFCCLGYALLVRPEKTRTREKIRSHIFQIHPLPTPTLHKALRPRVLCVLRAAGCWLLVISDSDTVSEFLFCCTLRTLRAHAHSAYVVLRVLHAAVERCWYTLWSSVSLSLSVLITSQKPTGFNLLCMFLSLFPSFHE